MKPKPHRPLSPGYFGRTRHQDERIADRSRLVRQLSGVWSDFENRLVQVPIISKIYEGRMTLEDYRSCFSICGSR